MNIVSLFDGISCAYVALQKAKIPIKSYTSYEIDKYAIAVSKRNNPTIKQCGDVKTLKDCVECDILIGGSPCTDLSIAKPDRKGLDGEHSSLFWEYIRIKKLLNPKWFVLENVASMSKADKDKISEAMGVQPTMFDASLLSGQSRKRYFWTNIPFTLPTDKGISLESILEPEVNEKYFTSRTKAELELKKTSQGYKVYDIKGKSACLKSNGGGVGGKTGLYLLKSNRIRRLTPTECERLQGLPDGYTSGVSDTQRYKCLGNAFNVDVVAHILAGINSL